MYSQQNKTGGNTMKQMIAKSRKEAIEFAEGGNGNTQRAAYWMQGKIIDRAKI